MMFFKVIFRKKVQIKWCLFIHSSTRSRSRTLVYPHSSDPRVSPALVFSSASVSRTLKAQKKKIRRKDAMSLLMVCHQIRCRFPVVTWNDSPQHVSFSKHRCQAERIQNHTERPHVHTLISSTRACINTAQKQASE